MIARLTTRLEIRRRAAGILLAALSGAMTALAGGAAATDAKLSAATNAAAIPQSVFTLPSANSSVKDPFFPKSTRLAAMERIPTNRVAVVAADLVLKGLSGRPDAPLATINDMTFGVGEERDVRTAAGRVRVRCVEINLGDESVVVEVAGTRRELRFPRRK
jgi:hypothetical protein